MVLGNDDVMKTASMYNYLLSITTFSYVIVSESHDLYD